MIFLVEDEPIYQKLISSALQPLHCEIDIANDGYSAIEKFKPDIHKLAIIDLVLPGPMNGIEVIRKLLQLKPDLTVLVCSGYGNHTIQTKIKKAGAHDFIYKPFTPDQMLDKVAAFLDLQTPTSRQQAEKVNNSQLENNAHDTTTIQKDTSIDTTKSTAQMTFPQIFEKFPTPIIKEIFKIGSQLRLLKQCRDTINYTESIITVTSGQLRCYCKNQVIGILEAGQSLGFESLTKEYDSHCNIEIEALTTTTLLIIPKIHFLQFFCNHSENLLAQLEQNLKHAMPQNLLYKAGMLNPKQSQVKILH